MIHSANLAFQYPGGNEIRFPDVDVPQGGVLLLRGPSGSGKSTWLALAAALLRPLHGRISVAGQDPNALQAVAGDAWRASTIGFLPQKLHLSAALTVQGNLELVFYAAGLANDAAAVATALVALGVADLRWRKPSQLSGGQAQRVALARAVLCQPKVILADEPTASLDDEAASAAIGLLSATAKRCGATLVIATHDARVLQGLPGAVFLNLMNKNNLRPSEYIDSML